MFVLRGGAKKSFGTLAIAFSLIILLSGRPAKLSADSSPVSEQIGQFGGTLVISERSEPKTLNPLIAADSSSRDIIGLIGGDLIHINRDTQLTEPALAESWSVSRDHLRYTVQLRTGLRFSDGHPCDADDVMFTFQSYLDENVHSPQRDLLIIAGEPISLRKVDKYTVVFTLSQPYAAAERLFDGIVILPRHLLQRPFDQRKMATAWGLNTQPGEIAGLGPFRLKQYVPGERLVLERNPYYWKKNLKGQSLPYLDQIACVFTPNADAEAMRFEAGDTDVINRLSAADFAVLEKDQRKRHFHLYDVGPGLEYSFLFFNQNALRPEDRSSLAAKQVWFRNVAFRQAISSAIDREAIIRLAFRGRARPLTVQVTPGNKRWVDSNIALPSRSLEQARRLMRSAGFRWTPDGSLTDSRGTPVEFSVAVNAGNPQQVQMATLIQQDLKELGVGLTPIALDFHTLLDRVFTTYKYEAAIMALADGDADPNSEVNVLTSDGGTHVWSLRPDKDQPAWQLEIDRLMHEQLTARDYTQRKLLYDRVQKIICNNAPVIFLVSPDILVGAKDCVGNFHPAILSNYTLWNAEQLFLRQSRQTAGHA